MVGALRRSGLVCCRDIEGLLPGEGGGLAAGSSRCRGLTVIACGASLAELMEVWSYFNCWRMLKESTDQGSHSYGPSAADRTDCRRSPETPCGRARP